MAGHSIRPINPYSDDRVTHEFATLNGRKYHYVHGMPKSGEPKATILCIHGFPDLWYSWRHIIPCLLDLGLRVIVPDMIGYGQTDAPRVKPEDIAAYSWKSSSDDMAELLRILNIPRVILLGHDWGGAIIYRIYFWHPEVVTHIASLCTPYFPPIKKWITLEDQVAQIPSFKYQIGFAHPQTEKDLESREATRTFLTALHRTADELDTKALQVTENIVQSMGAPARSSILAEEELDYYVEQYSRNFWHGPLNWYKIRKVNYEDEKNLVKETIDVPVFFVGAEYDAALPPSMALSQPNYIKDLTTREVKSGHFVMAEAPEEIRERLEEWIREVCLGGKSKL